MFKDYIATALPVVLVIVTSVFNLLLLAYFDSRHSVFGNTVKTTYADDFVISDEGVGAVINSSSVDGDMGAGQSSRGTNFVVVDSAYLLNVNNTLSNILPTREGLLIYKIQKGDTLSRIAASFGISLNTILWANGNIKDGVLKPGQEITILPVNGVLHQVQPGETLDLIAGQYSVDLKKIITFNTALSSEKLESRSTIVIPGARPLKTSEVVSIYNLPNLPGFFAIPTTGWNWGRLHNYNAVDIANACGTPVYASAEGLVIESVTGGWNSGYGQYIIIEHLNNTKTRYAHLQNNKVTVGDYMLKGDIIGYIGSTGKSDGPTGCHLHFEVMGAKNPFAK
ncbi:MAG: peptidase M23 family protein [Parcubacteria group bacterium Athens1014_26]|nr:MAG: peptidase M23 family protein [Parcubacteria group bacterium Athens1014_26]